MSNKNYDIIVIGAGCGGLTAAACAAKEGKKVLLLERNNTPGGFLGSFVRGRFEFEASLNGLYGFSDTEGLGDVRRIFDYLCISDKVKWEAIPRFYRLITSSRDGSKLDVNMPLGVDSYINTMESYVPGSKEALKKLFEIAEETYNATKHFSSIDGKLGVSEIHNIMKNYGNFIRTAPYSVNEVLSVLGLPEKAKAIFNAFWMHFGVDCDRLSFTHYALTVYTCLKYGSFIPVQRSHAISMALEGCVLDNGGKIRYNTSVSRIKFRDGRAIGVTLKNGEMIEANHIICNCSPTTVFGKMIKDKDIPKSALKRTNARTFGAKGACVYLGLNKSPEDLGIKDYSTYISPRADTAEQFNLMKKINTNTCLQAVCLNIANKEASPKGTTILTLSTIFTDNCWADVAPEEYMNEKDLLAARLISVYEKATGLTIHNAIEEIEVATPVTFARYTSSPQGTIHGYFASEWDSIIPRLMTEADESDTPGLRFCGGWGPQLSGICGSIASGRNTAFATFADINEEGGGNNE